MPETTKLYGSPASRQGNDYVVKAQTGWSLWDTAAGSRLMELGADAGQLVLRSEQGVHWSFALRSAQQRGYLYAEDARLEPPDVGGRAAPSGHPEILLRWKEHANHADVHETRVAVRQLLEKAQAGDEVLDV